MPSFTRNEPKEIITCVKISLNQEIYYCWKAKDLADEVGINAADLVNLGHLQVTNLPPGALSFFRAKAPKPARVKKQIVKNPSAAQKGSVSTFVGANFLQSALANGWVLVKGRRGVTLTKNARTTTAIVPLSNGLLYAYPFNTDDFNTYGAELGLQDSTTINTTAEQERLVSGTKNPIPGKATKVVPGGGKITTFFAADQVANVVANGWSIISNEIIAV